MRIGTMRAIPRPVKAGATQLDVSLHANEARAVAATAGWRLATSCESGS